MEIRHLLGQTFSKGRSAHAGLARSGRCIDDLDVLRPFFVGGEDCFLEEGGCHLAGCGGYGYGCHGGVREAGWVGGILVEDDGLGSRAGSVHADHAFHEVLEE